jgi:hypothetical protein
MNARSLIFVFSLVTATASGCAFGDRHVALQYPPPPDGAPLLARAPRPGITIVVHRFTDSRPVSRIGEVSNGFGMHTADVLAESDVTAWVAQAIARDLTAAGYNVRWATEDAASEPVQLSGQVVSTYCKAYFTYDADVSFAVQVSVGGRPVLNQLVVGRGGAGVNMAATESGYGQSLAIALRDAVAHLAAYLPGAVMTMPQGPPPVAPAPAAPVPYPGPAAASGPAS